MQTPSVKLYSLSYTQTKTYLTATIFTVGNILLPQLAHTVPQGGFIFLPIYFFTLVAAYKYGWQVGLLTAILSPIVNHLLFEMPPLAVLPAILAKSVCLALTAGLAARHFRRISIPILTLVVLIYQLLGTSIEWFLIGDLFKSLQDLRVGIPGILVQIVGGYFIINRLIHK